MASTTNATNNTMVSNTSNPTITTTKRSFANFKKCRVLVPDKNTHKKPTPSTTFKKSDGPHTNTFSVDSSLIQQRKKQQRDDQVSKNNKVVEEQLSDLGETAQEFSVDGNYTRICRAIGWQVGEDEKKVLGCCRRQWCTFAHSKQELRDPLCRWNDRCNNYNTGTHRECSHRHTCETRVEYYDRTFKVLPDFLPETNEKSRIPTDSTIPKTHPKTKRDHERTQTIKNFVKSAPVRPSVPVPINFVESGDLTIEIEPLDLSVIAGPPVICFEPTPFNSPESNSLRENYVREKEWVERELRKKEIFERASKKGREINSSLTTRAAKYKRHIEKNISTILTTEQQKKFCLLFGKEVLGTYDSASEMERARDTNFNWCVATCYYPDHKTFSIGIPSQQLTSHQSEKKLSNADDKPVGISKLSPISQHSSRLNQKCSFKITTEKIVETTADEVIEVVAMMKKNGCSHYTIKVVG